MVAEPAAFVSTLVRSCFLVVGLACFAPPDAFAQSELDVADLFSRISTVEKEPFPAGKQAAAAVEEAMRQGDLDGLDEVRIGLDSTFPEDAPTPALIDCVSREIDFVEKESRTFTEKLPATDSSSVEERLDKALQILGSDKKQPVDPDIEQGRKKYPGLDDWVRDRTATNVPAGFPESSRPPQTGVIVDRDGRVIAGVPGIAKYRDEKEGLACESFETNERGEFPLRSDGRLVDLQVDHGHVPPSPEEIQEKWELVLLSSFLLGAADRQWSDDELASLARLLATFDLMSGDQRLTWATVWFAVFGTTPPTPQAITQAEAKLDDNPLAAAARGTEAFAQAVNQWLEKLRAARRITIQTHRRPFQVVVETEGELTPEAHQQIMEDFNQAWRDIQTDLAAGTDPRIWGDVQPVGGQTPGWCRTVLNHADCSGSRAAEDEFLRKAAKSPPSGVRKVEGPITIPNAAVVDLATSPGTAARDLERPTQWGLERVGFGSSQDGDTLACPVNADELQPCTVAVIGSGVDFTHPGLMEQMWVNMKENPYNNQDDDGNGYVDDLLGWNFLDDSNDVMDDGGHDTIVTGVIASLPRDGWGVVGVNPRARVMALKVATFQGQADSIAMGRAIFYAVDNGARVINISYCGQPIPKFVQAAIDYAAEKDVLVVAPAGNKAADTAGHGPTACRGVLTVAGTTRDDTRARFSNWGQAVDLAAPAVDILSLRARGTDFLLYAGNNDRYRQGRAIAGQHKSLYRASGTSFAAPLVAGAASLLWSQRPELTAEQVRQILLMTADDIDQPGWDQNTGAGRLNVRKALAADPNHHLMARIRSLRRTASADGWTLTVSGQAEGSHFEGRWLQIGYGEQPSADDWTTVGYSGEPLPAGGLGMIPGIRFDRRGAWTIRLLARDGRGVVRQSRALLRVE